MATLKAKKGKVNGSLQLSHRSVKPKTFRSMTDVIATLDYSARKDLTLNSTYDLGTKKYKVGATWSGKALKKPVICKAWCAGWRAVLEGAS